MKNKMFDLIKGIMVGVANVIPGFSGGTMAVTFGIYERIIYAFSHILEMPKKVIKDTWALFIGIVVGVVLAIFGIVWLLIHFPIPTSLFFIGLIIGSIPTIQKKAKLNKEVKASWFFFFIGLAIILLLTFLNTEFLSINDGDVGIWVYIGLFFAGAIAAAAMVVPGISGSLVLLIFGYYEFTIGLLSRFIQAILAFDINGITENIFMVVILGFGILLGLILIAKAIEFWLKHHQTSIYACILGLLVASPIAIIVTMSNEYPEQIQKATVFSYLIGIICCALGIFLTIFLEKHHPVKDINTIEKEVKMHE